MVRRHYCPWFGFPRLLINEDYTELEVGVWSHWIAASNKVDASGEDYEWIRPVFEKLLAGIYKKIGSPIKALGET